MLRRVGERRGEGDLGQEGEDLDLLVFVGRAAARGAHAFEQHEVAAIGLDGGVRRAGSEQAGLAAEARRAAPTPTMAPVMVWVVETGMPKKLAISRVMAPPVSAQKPPTGLSLVMRCPMVLTMRQPPIKVPQAIAT